MVVSEEIDGSESELRIASVLVLLQLRGSREVEEMEVILVLYDEDMLPLDGSNRTLRGFLVR